LCNSQSNAAQTIVFGAQNDDSLGLENGLPVALNSQILVGYYNLSVTRSTFSAFTSAGQFLNNFTQLGTAVMGFDVDSRPATPNEPGLFAGGASIATGISTHNGKQLYYIVGNNSSISTSTQLGVFTSSSSAWILPSNPSGPTPQTVATDINQVLNNASNILFGSYQAGGGPYGDLYKLQTVIPEPSTGALMLIGAAGLVALRRLRKV
jgi:hypothetical protein